VTVGRLATHAAALVGLLLLVLLDRAERALPPGSWRRESVPGSGSSDADDGTNLRTVA
jgi:hypothetical protein